MPRTPVLSKHAPAPSGGYSQGIVAGGFLYLSGQGPYDPSGARAGTTIAEQVRQVLENLDAVATDLAKVDDKTYGDGGRSDVRMLTDTEGAMYARLPGDVWSLGGGFAVARVRTPLGGPMGFLSSADDKDKANVPWGLLVGIVVLASAIGIGFSVVEHTLPLRELVMQADRFKAGAMEQLAVARFRGAYRLAAQNVNLGMERVIEKSGGLSRKPADLESIIGPMPA